MVKFLLGFLVGYVVLSFLHEAWWGQRWMNFIQLPYLLFDALLEIIIFIVCFPFIFVWKLFRHCFRPVELERIQNLKLMDDSTHLVGSIYFCHDKEAKRFINKFFFYRVKKA